MSSADELSKLLFRHGMVCSADVSDKKITEVGVVERLDDVVALRASQHLWNIVGSWSREERLWDDVVFCQR